MSPQKSLPQLASPQICLNPSQCPTSWVIVRPRLYGAPPGKGLATDPIVEYKCTTPSVLAAPPFAFNPPKPELLGNWA